MPKTMVEKILSRSSGTEEVAVGDIVESKVDMAMSHDNTWLVAETFEKIGAEKIWDLDKVVVLLDHRIPSNTLEVASSHSYIRNMVKKYGIKNYYGERKGICHQVMFEMGHVVPGSLIVGADSHSTSYGAVGAMGIGIGASEMAAVWTTGKLWLKVPCSIRIDVAGEFPQHVHPKDLILKVIGDMTADGATYKSVEYCGDATAKLGMSGRITICNMSMEMGAKCAMVPPDEGTRQYLKDKIRVPYDEVHPDPDAVYEQTINVDLSDLVPMIAKPHTVDNVDPVEKMAGKAIDQAVLGSCTNGRLEDLENAAKVLEGHTVHPDVRMLVIPASTEVYMQALDAGIVKKLISAGCLILNSGCGPCLGAHQGILASSEVAITTTNRNFRGRMGSPESEIYLASPETVAASAIKGMITDPREVVE